MTIQIYIGDCRAQLATIAAESVQMVCTSPPYFGLRDYKNEPQSWTDGWSGSLGNESTPEAFVEHLVECFRSVHRVLHKSGVLFVNIGDSYSGSHGNGYKQSLHATNYTDGGGENFDLGQRMDRDDGCKPKDLIGVPWMLAFALRKDGWYLRQDNIWSKANCMPESVKDRTSRSHA